MNIFDSILVKKPNRSLFNLSHEVKLTGNMGYLYPILCQQVLPGDTWKVNSEVLCRLAPLTAPIMHRVNLKINYFFVPNRLIWDDWETFITGGEDGQQFPVAPHILVDAAKQDAVQARTLYDYLGFPTPDSNNLFSSGQMKIDALPFRAYNLIWNEYFRNQNLQSEIAISHASGVDNVTPMGLLMRNWEKDYFTSALPFVQRGNDVLIPIDGGNVNISALDNTSTFTVVSQQLAAKNSTIPNDVTQMIMHSSGGSRSFVSAGNDGDFFSDGENVETRGNVFHKSVADGLKGTLSSVNGNINDLRTAYRLQRWLENNARAGSRYIEQILSHFGVRSSDARLQRPEYLGGFSTPIIISEVLQNSGVQIDSNGDPVGTPQANMAGHGMTIDKSHYVKRFFEEHGYIIGLLSVIPRTNYFQGLPRQYQRQTRYDYYFPEFANLGEQDVKNNEVWFDFANPSTGDSTVFGYQQRYCEYRYIPSSIHGEFRSNLSFWHLARYFDTKPALNSDFALCSPRTDVFAVEDNEAADKLWIEVYNNIRAVRPMPKFAIPTL